MEIRRKSRFLAASSAAVLLAGSLSFAQASSANGEEDPQIVPNPPGVLIATTIMTVDGDSSEFSANYSPQPTNLKVDGNGDVRIFTALTEDDPPVPAYFYAEENTPDPSQRWRDFDGSWVPVEDGEEDDGDVENYAIGGDENCEITHGTHTYETKTVTVAIDGTYTFRFVSSSDQYLEDSFLAVYEGAFDPSDIDEDVIGCNDDRGEPFGPSESDQFLLPIYPEFTADLDSGKSYTLVLTTYSRSYKEDFAESLGTFELWGPSGGLVVDDETEGGPVLFVSPTFQPATPRPSQVKVTPGDGSLNVSIDFSNGSGGTPTSYRVSVSPGGNSCIADGATSSCEITGLTPGVEYTVSITARNIAGASAPYVSSRTYAPNTSGPASLSAKRTIDNFAAGSAKLRKPLRAEIRAFLDRQSEMTSFTCTGYAAGPKNPANRALAKERATNVCDFIEKVKPEVSTKTIGRAPGSSLAPTYRKVVIQGNSSAS